MSYSRTLHLLLLVSAGYVSQPGHEAAAQRTAPRAPPPVGDARSRPTGATPDVQRAALGVRALQAWYSPDSGLYRTTGWWNSANATTVLVDYSRVSGSKAFVPIIQNTFDRAQAVHPGFLNEFYDDEGWWALAWIDAYDLTGEARYRAMAESIFADMAGGWDTTTCGGGIWWSKKRSYKNAIANELFLSVAAQLADRVDDPAQQAAYLAWAQKEWAWFAQSGMINGDHLVNDGLDASDPAHCVNNGKPVYTYNQGVILGGLLALSRAGDRDSAPLAAAQAIGSAAIQHLTDSTGVLHERGEPNSGADGVQFKGIFVRNLATLNEAVRNSQYAAFLTTNARSIWQHARGPGPQFGQVWSGPFTGASAGTQSSALDALVAAASSSSHTVRARPRTRPAGGTSSPSPSAARTASRFSAPTAITNTSRDASRHGKVSVIRGTAGVSATGAATAITQRARSANPGVPGKSDAVCPSGPTPSSMRSNTGEPIGSRGSAVPSCAAAMSRPATASPRSSAS